MKKLMHIIVAATALLLSVTAVAAPISFKVSTVLITPGIGYGVDNNENGGRDLLDVRFTPAFSDTVIHPLNVGQSFTFKIGTVNFLEPNTGNQFVGIAPEELDNLGVTVKFTFTNPFGGDRIVTTTGVATLGPVIDSPEAVDFTLNWLVQTQTYGNGGQFTIGLNNLSFSTNTEGAKDLFATITYTVGESALDLPEPGSVALLGLGFGAMAFLRRRTVVKK
jgi:hypothetical protein